jgi:hypothetical protein
MVVILSVLGAVVVLGVSAGIFTWIYHYRGRSASAYTPSAINDDAVTPAMVEGYEEHYDETSSLLNR